MSRSTLILGTRGSKLAVHQSQWVQARLQELAPGLTISLARIQTSGDKILDVPLAKIGGKGLFVKEIEDALLSNEIDLAVHSMKDVPTALPEGLEILCVPPREDPRDALIKLHDGQFDAIVLAAAGLRRLAWEQEITEYLPVDVSLPAIAQGALGIEARSDDTFVRELLARFEHPATRITVTAERALLHRLEGGCQVPIAAHAVLDGDTLRLDGLVASVDGRRLDRRVHA